MAVGQRQRLGAVRADRIFAARRDVSVHRDSIQTRKQIQLFESRDNFSRQDHRKAYRRRLRGLHRQEYFEAARDVSQLFRRDAVSSAEISLAFATTSKTASEREGRFDANTGITVSNSGLNSPIAGYDQVSEFSDRRRREKQDVYDGVLKRSSLEEMWKPQTTDCAVGRKRQRRIYDRHRLDIFSRPTRRRHVSSATAATRTDLSATSISTRKSDGFDNGF